MKKLLGIFLTIILLTTAINAQQSFVLHNAVVDSGSNVSSAVTLASGYWLKVLYFPSMAANTTSFKILAYNYANSAYDTLYYDSEVYNPTISRAGCPYAAVANATYGIQKFKILLPANQTADITIKAEAIKQD